MILPNFIFVGTGKTGSTWLFKTLSTHPDVYMTPVKETNFFDLNYTKSIDYYSSFFSEGKGHQAVGEISHRYLHDYTSAEKIKKHIPNARIIACIREPVDYTISDYLFTKRNGVFQGNLQEWLDIRFDWKSLDYEDMLGQYVREFGMEQIFLYTYDEFKRDPNRLYSDICNFLEIKQMPLPDELLRPVNTASAARNKTLARTANKISKWAKRRNGQKLIALVKYSPLVQKLLYTEKVEKPRPTPQQVNQISTYCNSGLAWVEMQFGKSNKPWK